MVDVVFPLYRKEYLDSDHNDGTTIYARVDLQGDKLREARVTLRSPDYDLREERNSAVEVEVEFYDNLPGDEPDYALGQGEFACTPEEFSQALDKVRETIRQIAEE